MRNYLIISLLFLSVGICQQLIPDIIEKYRNGNIKSISYHKKSRNGIEKVKYEEYYGNGNKKQEKNYKDGRTDGLWTEWYENGQKKVEGTYKNGRKGGLWTKWYKNGKKWVKGTVKEGVEVGKWIYYNDNGSVKEIKDCDKGECDD